MSPNDGYMGTILRADLSKGDLKEIPFPNEWKKKYLGGSGVAAKIIYDEVPPNADPLGPKNELCFFTGPYTGTILSSARYAVSAKSPLTEGWGEANASGYWGPELKFTGFDGIIVTGMSEEPVYLWIKDGNPELKSAEDLWGKTTIETENTLKEFHSDKAKVLSIGPAGENLVRFACIFNDSKSAAGRCGLGAVMGSKKLKAVAVQGTKKVSSSNEEKLSELNREYIEQVNEHPGSFLLGQGTASTVESAEEEGDLPVKNHQLGEFAEAEELDFSGDTYQRVFEEESSCYKCPIGCKRWIKTEKEIAGVQPFEGHGPEYETVAMFGSNLLNSDLESVIAANRVCDAYGMDTISTGSIIAAVYEAYEKGIIEKEDIGFEPEWGDGKAAVRLAKMIANREGIGDLLAEGPVKFAEKWGKGMDKLTLHVKGQPVPAHDPRVWTGEAAEYAISNRGCCHLQGNIEIWQSIESVYSEQLSIDPEPYRCFGVDLDGQHTDEGKGESLVDLMSACNVFDALPFCKYVSLCLPSGEEITNMLNTITGWDLSPEDLLKTGKRLISLKRAYNNRCGFSREDDRLPERLFKPAPDVPEKHKTPNLELQMKEFYEKIGWDWKTGKPTRKKLNELDLENVANDLW